VEKLYYKQFETRLPYKAQKVGLVRTLVFQIFAVLFTGVGISYLYWRWTSSLNMDAAWFALPLVIAETLMFIGSLLMIINHWEFKHIPITSPVKNLSEIDNTITPLEDRPISIDLFIATYNEEKEVVEDTIKDALKLQYPFAEVKINIYLCDDGKRDGRDESKENFKALAQQYNIHYFVRENNTGYKAGNLNNAFWQSSGDFIVIVDADTRLFPGFLKHLTGYFRDEKMAWVQSPQWFYDIPQGTTLSNFLKEKLPKTGSFIAACIPFSKKTTIGENIFGTDPRIFYDSILRFRNSANAAFCCGAGSVHRRKALEDLLSKKATDLKKANSIIPLNAELAVNKKLYGQFANNNKEVLGPFIHHISEDIYTSILIHSIGWKSYQHPHVECKMLSPQSLLTYNKQFSRYAEGTYDICYSKNSPVAVKGLTLRQRLAYFETIYSYFSPLWIVVFLVSPILFYFTLTPPIKAFNFDFFLRFLCLNILNQIVVTTGNWGISTKRSEQYYIGSFWLKIKAYTKVVNGSGIQFNTTAKLKENVSFYESIKLIYPHLTIIILTFIGIIFNTVLIINETHPSYSAFAANTIWAFYNLYQLNPMIRAAFK
jgi:cellulose synthase (UDP-forming)